VYHKRKTAPYNVVATEVNLWECKLQSGSSGCETVCSAREEAESDSSESLAVNMGRTSATATRNDALHRRRRLCYSGGLPESEPDNLEKKERTLLKRKSRW